MVVITEKGVFPDHKEASSTVSIEHPLICFDMRYNWHDLAIFDVCLAHVIASKLGIVRSFGQKSHLTMPHESPLPSLHYQVKYGALAKVYAVSIELVKPGKKVTSLENSDLQLEFKKGELVLVEQSPQIATYRDVSDTNEPGKCKLELADSAGHGFELTFSRFIELAKLTGMLAFHTSGHWIDFAENAGFSLKRISS